MMHDCGEHPVAAELKRRIKECRQELLNLLYDWHYLQNILNPQIVFTYDTYFGDLEFELQKKSRVAAEIERRVELLSHKLRKGEKLTEKTIQFVNLLVQREFERRYAGFTPSNSTTNTYHTKYKPAESFSSNSFDSPQDNVYGNFDNLDFDDTTYNNDSEFTNTVHEVPKLYRRIVKKLHPDISGETEAFVRFWDNVQDAYRSRDVNRLRMFHQTLCAEDEKIYNDNKIEENSLRSEISQLEVNIAKEKKKISMLKQQEPFIYETKLNDLRWVERRQSWLKERLFQIDRRIQINKRMLRQLTAHCEKPKMAETA